MKIIRMLLGLCNHEWEVVDRVSGATYESHNSTRPLYRKLTTIFECSKCRKMKKNLIKY